MKVKFKDLLVTKAILDKLIQHIFYKKENNRDIVLFYKELNENYIYFNHEKLKLFKYYGEKTSDNGLKIPKDKLEVFNKELNELLDMEIDMKSQLNLTMDDMIEAKFCGDDDKQRLTPQDILILLEFFDKVKEE